MTTSREPTIAFLPWGDAWEDFYSTIGVSLETFANEHTGGWQFGFIEALKLYGISTVLFYTSTLVEETRRFIHKPSGTKVCILPVPKIYSKIRRRMIHPYPSLAYWGSLEDLFGKAHGIRRASFRMLRQIAPYLSTPLRLLAKEIRREGCFAIFCQEYEYFRFDLCILLGALLRLPVTATFQGGSFDCNRIGRFLRPHTIKRCHGLVIGPQAEIQRVQMTYALQSNQLARVFNPVNLKIWEDANRERSRAKFGLSDDVEVIMWHGRVDIHNKGLDLLIKAWQEVNKKYPDKDLRLFLLGSAEDASKLKKELDQLPQNKWMWIDKYVNDQKVIRDFLAAGDIYVFPSRWEGFPVAPLEAMACGLPVVAAEAAGIPDIFEGQEEAGGLIVPRDNSTALADAIGKMLENRSFRQELGKRAKRRATEYFSYQQIGKQLRDFLIE